MAYLAVCGHTNIDVQILVPELPRGGHSTPVRSRRTVYGGTACNIARHAGSLGVPVRLWSRVGDDFPVDWEAALQGDGVDLAYLDRVPGAGTPTCFILTDVAGEQAYCMDQGPMATMQDHPPGDTILEDLEGWLHLSTGDPHAYFSLADTARDAGISVAFDPGQELRFLYDTKSFERLLDASDTVFLNTIECRIGLDLLRYGDPVQLLDHVDTVVVTRGAEGASLYREGHKPVHQEAPSGVDVVDPTGAGDALRAGWYAALHAGHDMETALRWGQAAAAVVVGREGPQSHAVQRTDLERFLPRPAF